MKSQSINARLLKGQKGQAMIIAGVMVVALLIMGGFAVDTAHVFLRQSQVQRSLDAAAMAGITRYANGETDPDTIEAAAVEMAQYNLQEMGFTPEEIDNITATLTVDANDVATIALDVAVTVPTYFMRIIPDENLDSVTIDGAATSRRVPAIISLVLDTSGSMSGGKINALKTAANAFVDSFQDDVDRIAIIGFSDQAEVLRAMDFVDKDELHGIINDLDAGGWTNISHAATLGRLEVESVNNAEAVRAIVLFTDGSPNNMRTYFLDGKPVIDPNFTEEEPVYYDYLIEGGTKDVIDPFSNDTLCGRVTSCFNSYAYLDSRLNFHPGSDVVDHNSKRQLVQESYDLAIVEADYAKTDGVTVYSIGLGTQASEGGSPYQDALNFSPIKSYFLRRLANDPAGKSDPQFPGLPNSSSHPAGIYFQTPNVTELIGLFESVARRLKLRLVA